MKSDIVKKGIERAPHRSLFKAIGYTDAEIERPFIGIANSANQIVPGHAHLDKIVEAVKAGIYMGGGDPHRIRHHRNLRWDCHESYGYEICAGEPGTDCRFH